MAGPIDLSGIIPPQFSTTIITEAAQQSAVLQLGSRIPMGTKTVQFPVPSTFPTAEWVSTPGGPKPVSDLSLGLNQLTAEELAVIVLIPDQFIEDSTFGIWSYAQPLIAEALAAKLDNSVLWGDDAPATFPVGGLAAIATDVGAGGRDAVETVNMAMSAVETGGLEVTGSAADVAVRGALRGVRDDSGALLLGYGQVGTGTTNTLYGVPIAYRQFEAGAPGDFITGAWRYLLIGVRQDLRFRFSSEASITVGEKTISLFQSNMTALKVWARYGAVAIKPVTARSGPEGSNPFAIATLTGGNGGEGGEGMAARPSNPVKKAAPTAPAS